jgi:hypothetical protein
VTPEKRRFLPPKRFTGSLVASSSPMAVFLARARGGLASGGLYGVRLGFAL